MLYSFGEKWLKLTFNYLTMTMEVVFKMLIMRAILQQSAILQGCFEYFSLNFRVIFHVCLKLSYMNRTLQIAYILLQIITLKLSEVQHKFCIFS